MPQIMLHSFQRFRDLVSAFWVVLDKRLVLLLEHGQFHRDVKPVYYVITGGMEIRLEFAYRLAPIGQEQDRLVLLHALRFQQLPQSAPWLGIVGLREAKAFRRGDIIRFVAPEGDDTFPCDDFKETSFVTGADKPAIDTDRHRPIGCGLRGPFVLGALEQRVFLLTESL